MEKQLYGILIVTHFSHLDSFTSYSNKFDTLISIPEIILKIHIIPLN